MTNARYEGRLPAVETIVAPTRVTSPPAVKDPVPVPDLFVVDFSSLLRTFDPADEITAPVNGSPPAAHGSPAAGHPAAPDEVSDEDRTRYGVLLDRAAERGLLDPPEYRHRLEELAAANTVEEMNRIVAELPVLSAPRAATPSAKRSRRMAHPTAAGSTAGAGTGGGVAVAPPRRLGLWIVMAVLVVVAVVSLVIFAVSVDRLSRSHNSGLPAVPTLPVVSLHL